MITLGKRGDLHARRQALAFVRDPDVVGSFSVTCPSAIVTERVVYTRIVKDGLSDG